MKPRILIQTALSAVKSSGALSCVALLLLLALAAFRGIPAWASYRNTPQERKAPAKSEQRTRRAEESGAERERNREEHEREEKEFENVEARAEYFRQKRLPIGADELPYDRYQKAQAQLKQMRRFSTAHGKFLAQPNQPASGALDTWHSLGPGNIGGRTRAMAIHPATPNILYAAGVAGGVWKTTDSGANWTAVSDLLVNLAVSTLAMDPGNPNVLYAGTGESFAGPGLRGNGIFKTTDGGANWTQLAVTANNSNFHYVNKLTVSPVNSQRVYAATETGVFRSPDGGATWTQVHTQPRCTDLAIRTDQATDYLFASCRPGDQGTIYRNTNAGGGGAWDQVFTETGMGRTSLALAPSNQATVYALAASTVGGPGNNYFGGLHAVFRSTSNGDAASWSARVRNTDATLRNTLLLTNSLALCTGSFSNQGGYDNVIAVDPADANRVWAGGIVIFRSDDGGANWGLATGAGVDYHAMVFHPQFNGTTNQTMYVGFDQGIARSLNARGAVKYNSPGDCGVPVLGNAKFNAIKNNFRVTQFYHGVPYPDGLTYLGGTQDTSTPRGSDDTDGDWQDAVTFAGDGGYVAVDPTNTNILYAETSGFGTPSIQKSMDGGATYNSAVSGITDTTQLFVRPFVMDPNNSQRLWAGGRPIWRTNNGAANWVQASAGFASPFEDSSAIAVAPTDSNRVVMGTDFGNIYRTTVGTTSNSGTTWPSSQPRSGYVSWVAFDPGNASVVYATYSSFNSLPTDRHVYKSTDGGQTWTGIDGTGLDSIPDVPVHCIVIDPANTQRLYVGTDVGVFASTDGGATWAVENSGFANVITEALAINSGGPTKYLFAFTHGRGAWRTILGGSAGCPAISSVDPPYVAAGSTLTIKGSGFVGVASVTFSNSVAANFTVVSDSRIDAVVPAGAGSGTVTVGKSSCSNAQSASVTICAATPAVTVAADDGFADGFFGGGTGQTQIMANRLTPGSYPATVSQVVLFFRAGVPAGTGFTILVGRNLDGDSNINNTDFQAINATVTANERFIKYNVPPVTINSGDFVVGIRFQPTPTGVNPFAYDGDAPLQQRTYTSTNDGVSFIQETSLNGLIRATVFPGQCDNCPFIVPTPATLPNGVTGAAYNQTLGTNAGVAPITYIVQSGSLPPGLSLSSGGVLSGTPNQLGSFQFIIKATDANGCSGARFYRITTNCNTSIGLTPSTLPSGDANVAYNQAITATGGISPYTFTLPSGALPTGITLSSTGLLSGTTTQNGTFNFTIRATDNLGCFGELAYTLTMGCPLTTIYPLTLPAIASGNGYTRIISAIGAAAPYSFAVTSGALPAGLTLSAAGTLSGTASPAGTHNFTVTVTDANGCIATRAYGLLIYTPTIVVNTTADTVAADGFCSLREAITAVNNSAAVNECPAGVASLTTISFNVGTGTPTINITGSTFPIIAKPIVIDGGTGGATRIELNGAAVSPAAGFYLTANNSIIRNMVINRFTSNGIILQNNSGNTIENCYVGTTANGLTAAPNGFGGILLSISTNNIIGGNSPNTGNVISGNSSSAIFLSSSNNNVIAGNLIGRNAANTANLGNQQGVNISASSSNSVGGLTAAEGNVIAGNTGYGIAVTGASTNNALRGNATFGNNALGIDLGNNGLTANDANDPDTGPNNLQNFPVLNGIATAGTVTGTIDSSTANSAYPIRLEFFANTACDSSGNGEGEVYLGFTNLAAPGSFSFAYTPLSGKSIITATATDANGNTSEFSNCAAVCPTINIGPPTLTNGTVNVSYSQSVAASGGTAPYTYTLDSGVLPAGLSLSTGGTISGTPTQTGGFSFTVRATAANGCFGTRTYTLIINCTSVSLNPSARIYTAAGGSGSFNVTASGGCNWVASSNQSWLTITSGSSGTGNGTVGYTVAPHTGESQRIGQINVSGQTFIAQQYGLSESLILLPAANFAGTEFAPNSAVIALGKRMATSLQKASTYPLPTTLALVRVTVQDSASVSRDAGIFFVSPGQINFLVPTSTAPGLATVSLEGSNGDFFYGTMQVAAVAPSIFTVDNSPNGFLSGYAIRDNGSTQTTEAITRFDPSLLRFVALPINLGPPTDQVFLVLNGGGIRNRSSLAAVNVTINGTPVTVNSAGAATTPPGFDQLNLLIPRSLIGSGEVNIAVTVDGKSANTVKVHIQ